VQLTILGGGGAWPTARQACGGYLVEHDGFTLLVDPGYGVLPRLLAIRDLAQVDAVMVSHGHLDHCADLNPLLRARVMGDDALGPLPVYAPANGVRRGADIATIGDGDSLRLGPLTVDVSMLPHHLPNAGMRISAGGWVIAYTGDSGDCHERIDLAADADVLLAEATYPGDIPPDERPYLSSARQVARVAIAADARSTILTHGWPGDPAEWSLAAARREGLSSARVAFAGMSVDLSAQPSSPLVPPLAAIAVGMSRPQASAVRGRRASANVNHPHAIPVLPRRAATV
jgi:ribonuclease BN (tRNA processing enzyme)